MSLDEYRERHRVAFLQQQNRQQGQHQQQNGHDSLAAAASGYPVNLTDSAQAEAPQLPCIRKSPQQQHQSIETTISHDRTRGSKRLLPEQPVDRSSNNRSGHWLYQGSTVNQFVSSPSGPSGHQVPPPLSSLSASGPVRVQPLCTSASVSASGTRTVTSCPSSTPASPSSKCPPSGDFHSATVIVPDDNEGTSNDALLARLVADELREQEEAEHAMAHRYDDDEAMDEASAAAIQRLIAEDVRNGNTSDGVRLPDHTFQEQLISDYHHHPFQIPPVPPTAVTRATTAAPTTVSDVLDDQELARRMQEDEFLRDDVG